MNAETNKRDGWITSVEQYKKNYPDESRALLAVFADTYGSIVRVYYQGNVDKMYLAQDITTYVYVNNWRVISIADIQIS